MSKVVVDYKIHLQSNNSLPCNIPVTHSFDSLLSGFTHCSSNESIISIVDFTDFPLLVLLGLNSKYRKTQLCVSSSWAIYVISTSFSSLTNSLIQLEKCDQACLAQFVLYKTKFIIANVLLLHWICTAFSSLFWSHYFNRIWN